MFEDFQGAKKGFGEARRWFRKAAGQRDAETKTTALRLEEKLRERQQFDSIRVFCINSIRFEFFVSMGACANCGASETAGSVALGPC
jgi:hypothetical protein